MLKFVIHQFLIGDSQVGVDHINGGNKVWGYTIISIMFLPNLVFIVWFTFSHRGSLLQSGTWAKILIAGSVQLLTFLR